MFKIHLNLFSASCHTYILIYNGILNKNAAEDKENKTGIIFLLKRKFDITLNSYYARKHCIDQNMVKDTFDYRI